MGDGTEDMNPSHTYTKAGIYTIATGNLTTFATGSVISDAVSSPIVRFRQLSSSLTNGLHLFDSWKNLMIIDNIGHNLNTYEYLCNNCTSLSNDILFPATARNVTKAFYGCSNLLYIHSNWDNNYSGTISHTDCYGGCNSITHIDGQNVIAYKENLEEMKKQKICPYCKSELVLRNGKNGKFYGCKNFPKCRYTMKFEE